jgi:hypothetical protein
MIGSRNPMIKDLHENTGDHQTGHCTLELLYTVIIGHETIL